MTRLSKNRRREQRLEAQAVSKNTVNRLWQLHNIKPHLSRTFKLSRDAKTQLGLPLKKGHTVGNTNRTS